MTDPDDQRAEPWLSTNRVVWLLTGVAVVLFWLISTSFRPWDLLDRAGFSADFYDEQARVFLRGRLDVDPSVPGPEGFLIGGRTYLYYGPFLSVVRMPFALFGDLFTARLVRVSMLVALVVICRWAARLARAGQRVVHPSNANIEPVDGRWGIAVFVAAVAFSPVLFAAGWISVYHETELWAMALAIVAITLVAEWAASGFVARRPLVGACLAALGCTMTRAPIGLGVAVAVGACGLVLLARRRRLDTMVAGALVGGLLPLIAHGVVNRAKFGTWLSVPGDRQLLSIQNEARSAFFETTGGSFFSLDFLPTTLAQYWRPDAIRFERLVPGVRFGPLAPDLGATAVETVTPSSSLTTSALLLLLLALVGMVWVVRRRALTWGLIVATTAAGAIPTFLIGFVANRYLIDMLPPLAAAGAIGVWVMDPTSRRAAQEAVAGRTSSGRLLSVGVAALAAAGVWVNTSLAVWSLELKSPGFTEFRYDVDRAVFGRGEAPGLVSIASGEPVPRDGVVGILADCTGVYVAEQGKWVAMENSAGQREISGTVDTQIPSVLAATSTWSLELRPIADDRAVVVFARQDGIDGFEREIQLADETIEFAVVADPVAAVYAAEIGNDAFFLPADVLRAGEVELRPARGVVTELALCVELESSLAGTAG